MVSTTLFPERPISQQSAYSGLESGRCCYNEFTSSFSGWTRSAAYTETRSSHSSRASGKKQCIVFSQTQLLLQPAGIPTAHVSSLSATITKAWPWSLYSTVSLHLERLWNCNSRATKSLLGRGSKHLKLARPSFKAGRCSSFFPK